MAAQLGKSAEAEATNDGSTVTPAGATQGPAPAKMPCTFGSDGGAWYDCSEDSQVTRVEPPPPPGCAAQPTSAAGTAAGGRVEFAAPAHEPLEFQRLVCVCVALKQLSKWEDVGESAVQPLALDNSVARPVVT